MSYNPYMLNLYSLSHSHGLEEAPVQWSTVNDKDHRSLPFQIRQLQALLPTPLQPLPPLQQPLVQRLTMVILK